MKKKTILVLLMIVALFMFACGTSMTVSADPWDVEPVEIADPQPIR
jgi:ABC-type glycerol-3-phosphate transport system substrate-binding protein